LQSDQYNHGNNLANVEALLEAAPEVDGALSITMPTATKLDLPAVQGALLDT